MIHVKWHMMFQFPFCISKQYTLLVGGDCIVLTECNLHLSFIELQAKAIRNL